MNKCSIYQKIFRIYYLETELDDNFQNVKLDNSTSTLPQIKHLSSTSPVYKTKNNKYYGDIYYTCTLYSNKVISNGTIEINGFGSFFYSFITDIVIVDNEPIIPNGTIIKTSISSGSGYFLNKVGDIVMKYLEGKRVINIFIY
jgi:hypothetical protein